MTSLFDGIRDLRVAGEGASLAPGPSAAERVIRHAPGAPLVVRYHILGSSPADPVAIDGNDYRPVLRPGYFHVLGETAFIRLDREATTPVRFSAPRLPPGWSFASDLEHGDAEAPLTMETIGQSVLVGGDFRILDRGPLRVAIRGAWGFGDEAFIDELVPLIESHAQAFRDSVPRYLVTVLPLRGEEGQISMGGTGLGDAFAFFATRNVEQAQLRRMLAHEHLHTWIPGRLGRMPERDEAKDYWFSEGFTDFFTIRLLVRAGIWGPGTSRGSSGTCSARTPCRRCAMRRTRASSRSSGRTPTCGSSPTSADSCSPGGGTTRSAGRAADAWTSRT